MRATHAFHDLLRTEVKRTMSPTKSPLEYLHKHSNLRNFAAWDVSGRLGSIEQEFARMKSTIEKTDSQQEVWKESVEMYKSRGKVFFGPTGCLPSTLSNFPQLPSYSRSARSSSRGQANSTRTSAGTATRRWSSSVR